ncbi:F-box/LRR-repeat protein 2 [Choanephora cucurbitarum]|uniref:F-box/LRR-repeat protein 2 n=1 Tax=Choanephora cucurbitarum TaxID=101091 RepID=A0A1C7NEW2_9FUNG|nr:F-box/LRR-repeat protein 2 [Choanephora cucurbitarum]
MIFQHLTINDLYHATSVSKHWHTLTTPILWNSPIPSHPLLSCLASFKAIDKKYKITHVHQRSHLYAGFPIYLPHYGHAVKSLDLSLISAHVTDCTIRYIVRSCPHLTSLNLSDCRFITNESLRYLGQNHQLQALILQNCRQITDTGLNYLKCQPLATLHLGGCHRVTDDGIISLVTDAGTSLRRLCLSDCIHVTGKSLQAISRRCSLRLEWLDIARTQAIQHNDLVDLVTHCPNITRLNISLKKPKLHDPSSHHMLGNPLNELIDLLDQFNIQPSLTPASAQHRLTLSEQRLARNVVVNPHTIECVVLHLQKLENLNLSYWTTLTDKAAQAISMHGHCLTYLNLIGCKSVTKKGLKYLSDLCERKSTCITLGKEWMITPNATYSFESSSGWASASSDEESRTKRLPLSKRPSRQIGTKTLIVKA